MPLSAQFNHTLHSIALFVVFNSSLTLAHTASASELVLPPLENSAELDRILMREITDDHVVGKQHDMPDSPQVLIDNEAKPAVVLDTETGLEAKNTDAPATQAQQPAEDLLPATAAPMPVTTGSSDTTDSVWAIIQQSNRLPLRAHDRVNFYQEQYKRESMWISKILQRGTPYLAHLVSALDQRFLPVELALLPAIESGFQPTARSAGRALGLWQIVPITAKEIGIERNVWFDGRADIIASTTAAVDYLSYLNAEFNGDWELTLAAYNAGPGRVRAAVRKNKKAGLPTDYWSLTLPEETQNYVPKLVALVSLIKHSNFGGFDIEPVPLETAFDSIDVGFRVSLDRVSKITGIDESTLRALNAGLTHGVTPPDGPHHLLIPSGSGEQFQAAFADIDTAQFFSEPKTHQVVAGDTVSSIALKYGVSQKVLLDMNGLDNANIKIGQKLAVTHGTNMADSVVQYTVSIGDTLSAIADKFSVKVRNITKSSGEPLNDDVIHPGDTLNIMVNTQTSG
jgi:membrane-bound lytic murein transglycosylase D